MNKEEYIKQVTSLVKKHAPLYGIKVYSPIIAQFCKESAFGTTELAIKAQNYAGIKLKAGRTPIAIGGYDKDSKEVYNGTSVIKNSTFAVFKSLEDCVIGYFQFLSSNTVYDCLRGVKDAATYCIFIGEHYATDPNYAESLVNDYIVKYNLTQYDDKGADMVLTIHAGHNPDGKIANGAVGILKESTENRRVCELVIKKLALLGITAYDCTVNDGLTQSGILKSIVKKCNSYTRDYDISIHFNSASSSSAKGTEVFIYSDSSKAKGMATNIVKSISELGFVNRGVKTSSSLYFLKNTDKPAILIECCFVNGTDPTIYNAEAMATAIVKGITGISVSEVDLTTPTVTDTSYKVKCLDNMNIRNAPNGKLLIKNGCKKGTVYTIVETNGNWGKLKSGAGWINVAPKYAQRV